MFVYIMEMTGQDLVKIGVAANPMHRLKQLQTGLPFGLELAITFGPYERKQAFAIERGLHSSFRRLNIHREWFAKDWALALLMKNVMGEPNPETTKKILDYAKRPRPWNYYAFRRWSSRIDSSTGDVS